MAYSGEGFLSFALTDKRSRCQNLRSAVLTRRFRDFFRSIARRLNYVRVPHLTYGGDGLFTSGKYAPFLDDKRFMAAYDRAIRSGHMIGGEKNVDLHIEWRVAIACWAARHATQLRGDFVECGVNTGILSLAVCDYVNFNSLDKSCYLFDTFAGIPESQMSEAERATRLISNTKYPDCYELTSANFKDYPRVTLVRGLVPDTLQTVDIEAVSYLSIDMNIAYPERKAIEHFWPLLSPGAMVLLDDYGWMDYEERRRTMDEFAKETGVAILALPTGQGLIIKP